MHCIGYIIIIIIIFLLLYSGIGVNFVDFFYCDGDKIVNFFIEYLNTRELSKIEDTWLDDPGFHETDQEYLIPRKW